MIFRGGFVVVPVGCVIAVLAAGGCEDQASKNRAEMIPAAGRERLGGKDGISFWTFVRESGYGSASYSPRVPLPSNGTRGARKRHRAVSREPPESEAPQPDYPR